MMNKTPTTFTFEEHAAIRVLCGDDGEPRFVAADVCKALDLEQVSRAVARLDDDEKGVTTITTPGGSQQMVVITESGLYSLILTSRKSEAKAFKRWITHEVLPSLRKTGQYSVRQTTPTAAMTHIQQLKAFIAALEDHESRITQLEAIVQREPDYYTVLGYARLVGRTLSLNEAQSIGQRAAHLSRDLGLDVGKTTDPRFGQVNTYHLSVLQKGVRT